MRTKHPKPKQKVAKKTKQTLMDKIKIKRVQRKKKQTTTKEKILAGLGLGSTLIGGAAAVAPQQNQTKFVSTAQASEGSKTAGIKAKIGQLFGVSSAKASSSVDAAKAQLDTAKSNLSSAQSALSSAEQGVTDAFNHQQQAVDALNAAQSALSADPGNADLQAAVSDAENARNDAATAANDSLQARDSAQSAVSDAQAAADAAQAAYDAAVAAEQNNNTGSESQPKEGDTMTDGGGTNFTYKDGTWIADAGQDKVNPNGYTYTSDGSGDWILKDGQTKTEGGVTYVSQNNQWVEKTAESAPTPKSVDGIEANQPDGTYKDGSVVFHLSADGHWIADAGQDKTNPDGFVFVSDGSGGWNLKDGQTKTENGVTYTSKDGQWVKQTTTTPPKSVDGIEANQPDGTYKDGSVVFHLSADGHWIADAGQDKTNPDGFVFVSDGSGGWNLKDGQTKTENGKTYISKDGQWSESQTGGQISVNFTGVQPVSGINDSKVATVTINGQQKQIAITKDGDGNYHVYDSSGQEITTTISNLQALGDAFFASASTTVTMDMVKSDAATKSWDQLTDTERQMFTNYFANGAHASEIPDHFAPGSAFAYALEWNDTADHTVNGKTYTLVNGQWQVKQTGVQHKAGDTQTITRDGGSIHQTWDATKNDWVDAPQSGDTRVSNGIQQKWNGTAWVNAVTTTAVTTAVTVSVTMGQYPSSYDPALTAVEMSIASYKVNVGLDSSGQVTYTITVTLKNGQTIPGDPLTSSQLNQFIKNSFATQNAWDALTNDQKVLLVAATDIRDKDSYFVSQLQNSPAYKALTPDQQKSVTAAATLSSTIIGRSPSAMSKNVVKGINPNDGSSYEYGLENPLYYSTPAEAAAWQALFPGSKIIDSTFAALPTGKTNFDANDSRRAFSLQLADGTIVNIGMLSNSTYNVGGQLQLNVEPNIAAQFRAPQDGSIRVNSATSSTQTNNNSGGINIPAGLHAGDTVPGTDLKIVMLNNGNLAIARPDGSLLPGYYTGTAITISTGTQTTNTGTGNQTVTTGTPAVLTGTGTGVTAATSLKFTNITAGNTSTLAVGDQWKIEITGPANQKIFSKGGMNGQQNVTQIGTTDANGNFVLTGTITADQVGPWSQVFSIGPSADQAVVTFNALNFTVIQTRATSNQNGNNVTTVAAPVLTSLSKTTAGPGDSIVITGSGFNSAASYNYVEIVFANGGTIQAPVTAVTATSVTFTVPTNIANGQYKVQVKNLQSTNWTPSNQLTFTVTGSTGTDTGTPPTNPTGQTASIRLTSLSQSSVARGGRITINGTGFNQAATANITELVTSTGTIRLTVVATTPTSLTVLIPGTITPGTYQVQVRDANDATNTPSNRLPLTILGEVADPVATPTMTFANANGSSTFKVGDQWRLTIANAQASSPVTVSWSHTVNGQTTTGTDNIGTTDAQGSFSGTYNIDASQVGDWSMVVKVGGTQVGNTITFTVVPNVTASAVLTLSQSAVTLQAGSTATVTASAGATTGFAAIPVTVSSSNTAVATATSTTTGQIVITGVSAGTAVITVHDAGHAATDTSTDKTIAVTVTAAGAVIVAPSITTTSLPSATVGSTYSYQLAASGGSGTLTFSQADGALPPGLTISSAGIISGTPTVSGNYNFLVKVTDSQGQTATKMLSIQVVTNQGTNTTDPTIAALQAQIAQQQAQINSLTQQLLNGNNSNASIQQLIAQINQLTAQNQNLQNQINQLLAQRTQVAGVTTFQGLQYQAPAAEPVQTSVTTYTVKKGDTLWAIAQRYYGDGRQWRKIMAANADKVKAPRLLQIGTVLVIPN